MTEPKTPSPAPLPRHGVRTFFSAIFGTLALSLILTSVLVVWLERTLTDTATYVKTVAPLATQPVIQNYLGQRLADLLLESAPVPEVAQQLLPQAEIANKSEEQLRAALRVELTADITGIVNTAEFAELWESTNESAHSQLIMQLKRDSGNELTLNLSPALTGAIERLKASKLGAVADKVELPEGAGVIRIKNSAIANIHDYYVWLQQGTLVILLITLLCVALAIVLSVHHAKTLRRILVGTGIIMILLSAAIQVPRVINISGSDAENLALAAAISRVLLHNLGVATLVIGVGSIVLAIVSKLVEVMQSRR